MSSAWRFLPTAATSPPAASDQAVTLWDVDTGQAVHVLRGHSALVLGVAFSPDGRTIASASHDSTVKLWDVATGKHQKTLRGHGNESGV